MEQDQETRGGGTSLALAGSRKLVVERGDGSDTVRIVEADGGVSLTLEITPAGPVLRFEGNLALEASGDLGISGRRVAIHAREGLDLSSGADASIQVEGDLHSNARIQHITADLGNVNVRANDDVKLNGERVMVNC